MPENIVIEKIFGKLASRPELDILLEQLRLEDQVYVTRLRLMRRNHQLPPFQ